MSFGRFGSFGRPAVTIRQARVVDFIRAFLADKGFPPTQAEIAAGLGFRSQNAAAEHVRLLARKGVLRVEPGLARGLRLLPQAQAGGKSGTARKTVRSAEAAARAPAGAPALPLIGEVAAGQPILAQENVEREVELDPRLFSPRADFLLRVRGESMVEAGILPDDLVAIHQTRVARDGEIAVVRLDDDVTVKRWRTRTHGRKKEVVLEPANAALSAVVVDPTRVQVAVEGVVVGLLRRSLRP
jgi:repressor LexA